MKVMKYNEFHKEDPLDFLCDIDQAGEINLKDCIDKEREYRLIIQDITTPINWKKLKAGIKTNIMYNVKLCSGFEDMCIDMSRNHRFVFPYKTFQDAYIKARKDIPITKKDVYDVNLRFRVSPFRIVEMEFILVRLGGNKE